MIALFFSSSILESGVKYGSTASSEKLGADMILFPPLFPTLNSFEVSDKPILVTQPLASHFNESILNDLVGLPGIDALSPQLYVATLNRSLSPVPLQVIAFDPRTDFTLRPWLSYQEENLIGEEAIAGAATGLLLDAVVGVDNVSLKVVAIAYPTNSSLDYTIFFPLETAYSLTDSNSSTLTFRPGQISAILIKISQDATADDVKAQIENHMQSFRLVETPALVSRVRVETTGIASYEQIVQIIMGGSMIALIASIFSMTLNERIRQIGLLRSLGATRVFIFRNVLAEAGLMAAIGSILGLVIGAGVLYFAGNYLVATFNIPFLQPTLEGIVSLSAISIFLGVLIGAVASTYPAYVASGRDPYDAIRKGE